MVLLWIASSDTSTLEHFSKKNYFLQHWGLLWSIFLLLNWPKNRTKIKEATSMINSCIFRNLLDMGPIWCMICVSSPTSWLWAWGQPVAPAPLNREVGQCPDMTNEIFFKLLSWSANIDWHKASKMRASKRNHPKRPLYHSFIFRRSWSRGVLSGLLSPASS